LLLLLNDCHASSYRAYKAHEYYWNYHRNNSYSFYVQENLMSNVGYDEDEAVELISTSKRAETDV
jgi:hypothetical protein